MQHHTSMQVIGHHSPSAQTRSSSMSFNGLELKLESKPQVSKQFDKLKMIINTLIVTNYKCPPISSLICLSVDTDSFSYLGCLFPSVAAV